MSLTQYDFANAVSGFYEIPTARARSLLPAHLHPLEVQHGSGVLAVTAFDFTDSMVGSYQEIVLAIIVPPLVRAGDPFPKSAQYPFLVGTSTVESREHAIERWHLPHYMKEIAVDFAETAGRIDVQVREKDDLILELGITDYKWEPASQLHQCFMLKNKARYKVDMHLKGSFTEHEEERGSLILHEHPMTENLPAEEIPEQPFRELRMKGGVQIFHELETI